MHATLIESSRFMQQVLSSILKNAGFSPQIFLRGAEALQSLEKTEHVGLICLSLQLADTDGLTLSKRLRALHHLHQVPIVLITSNPEIEDVKLALSSGVTEVFYKSDLNAFQTYVYGLSRNLSVKFELQGKVLFLEDSPSTARVVKDWLKNLGLSVLHLTRAEEGLEVLKRDIAAFDLVISDFLLEGKMSGLGLVREIRQELKSKIPVLVLSGLEDETRRIEILKSGASDFIAKPVQEEEFLARVALHLENKKLLDEVEKQRHKDLQSATLDPLTGLINRHHMIEVTQQKIAAALSEGKNLSFVLLDLDDFRSFNQNKGLETGDEVLVQVANQLKESLPKQTILARFGGDEFAYLSSTSKNQVQNNAEELRVKILNLKISGQNLSASFGLAEISKDKNQNFDSLFLAAEKALVKAKGQGKNRVEAG